MLVYDEPWQTYLEHPGMNASLMVHGLKSMKHLRYEMDRQDRPDTAAMRGGRLKHSLIQQLGAFDDCFTVMPDYHMDESNVTDKGKRSNSKSTKYYKERSEEFRRANQSKDIVTQAEYDASKECVDAVFNDPIAARLIDQCRSEVSVYGEMFGVECKGRVDLYDERTGTLVDTKTTQNVNKYAFGRQFANLNIAFRLAWYRQLIGEVRNVYLITVESAPPYDVAVVPVPEIVLDNQVQRIVDVLDDFQRCLAEKRWPGVAGGELYELYLPQWALTDEEVFSG